jgi:hypothetical protein
MHRMRLQGFCHSDVVTLRLSICSVSFVFVSLPCIWCYGSLPKAPVMHLDENAVNKLDGPSEQESADLLPHQIPVIGLRLV